MLPDDRPDCIRRIGSTLRWLVYLARAPPRGSVGAVRESVVKTIPWRWLELTPPKADHRVGALSRRLLVVSCTCYATARVLARDAVRNQVSQAFFAARC